MLSAGLPRMVYLAQAGLPLGSIIKGLILEIATCTWQRFSRSFQSPSEFGLQNAGHCRSQPAPTSPFPKASMNTWNRCELH